MRGNLACENPSRTYIRSCPFFTVACGATSASQRRPPVIRRPRPSPILDGVEEADEDPLRTYTTLGDDTDNAHHNSDSDKRARVSTQVAMQIVVSPGRARSQQKSRKRDRAPTVSSTGSKEEEQTQKASGGAGSSSEYTHASTSPSRYHQLTILYLCWLPRSSSSPVCTRRTHDRTCAQTQEGHGHHQRSRHRQQSGHRQRSGHRLNRPPHAQTTHVSRHIFQRCYTRRSAISGLTS